MSDADRPAVVLDVDGTLIDTNYHHAIAWSRAFEHVGVAVPVWRIHRAIGMGGDKLVAAVAGDDVESDHGDQVRDRWEKEYDATRRPRRDCCLAPASSSPSCAERGVAIALASSSIPKHAEHAFDLLDADDLADVATTAEDVDESKPDPELIEEALSRLGTLRACVVGDSVYDVEAATAGRPAGVRRTHRRLRTGGARSGRCGRGLRRSPRDDRAPRGLGASMTGRPDERRHPSGGGWPMTVAGTGGP